MSEINTNTNEVGFGLNTGIEFDLGLLVSIIKRSWIWVLLILSVSGATAYTYIHYTAPVYESSSVIQTISDKQANRLLNVEDIYQSEDISKDIELLRSEEFFKRVVESLDLEISYFTEELKKIYDIIIIDNPPVGLVKDGIASLKLADYPIYVFRSEYSKKSFVDNINRIFIENKITNLSAVLNSVDLNRARYGS
jgi:cellulose biosynthesis protein BcsQ